MALGPSRKAGFLYHPWLPGSLLGLILVLVLFRDLIIAGPSKYLWADGFDSKLLYWTVEWGYHALFDLGSLKNFFHANAFYPHSNTLAYSDSLISIQLFFGPLRLLGLHPLHCLYGALALTFIFGCTLTYFALGKLQLFSPLEKMLIVLCAHFSLSITQFLYHYQLFGFNYAPSFLIFLFLFLSYLRKSDLIGLSVIFALGVCFAVYLAPMLTFLGFVLACLFIVPTLKREGVRKIVKDCSAPLAVVVGLTAVTLYFVQFKPYLEVAKEYPPQRIEETVSYAANIRSLVTESSVNSFWYGSSASYANGDWEHAYFPGYILLGFCALYAAVFGFRVLTKRSALLTTEGMLGLYALALFALCYSMSLGPFYKGNPEIEFPYFYLAPLAPGLDGLRAPGRFGMFFGLSFGIFTVLTLRSFLGTAALRNTIGLICFALILGESLPKFQLHPFVSPSDFHQALSNHLSPGTPLLELPVAGKDHYDTVSTATDQLIGSTAHWARMVSGYGAKATNEYFALLSLDQKVQAGEISAVEIINFARRLGIQYIAIHLDRYSPPLQADITAAISPEVSLVYTHQNSSLFRIKVEQPQEQLLPRIGGGN